LIDYLERIRGALSGRYTVEKELGRGGMATVYLARDLKHDRAVAIKVMHPELAAVLGAERFLREIKIAAGLNHPHILPLHDSGEAGGFLFFVMPRVQGESLRDRLNREKQLPVDDALRIAREVADALSYAHAHGVVHRDIKPENILLEGGHAVVADFGIARAIGAAADGPLTQTGMSVGTPVYMSPEQASGSSDLDGRSDLYSLACMLYEMLAGQPPFTGATVESVVRQHLTADPPNITRIRPAVPAEVAAALARALAKAPADRFNPVALFGEALGRRDLSTPAVLTATRAGLSRRTWQIAGLCAALALIVGGMLSLGGRLGGGGTAVTGNPRTVVAVLPLQNLTADARHAYFAGGLHDEILTQLSKISALKVISRTSVLSYVGKNTPLKQIAQELGAGTIVEGTVQVVGTRLRVNVQLIDAATETHLWAESYDRTLNDAFAIQSDVARNIVAAVGAALPTGERQALAAAPTGNAEAYRLYLQGREYLLRAGRLRQNYEIAQNLFERSVALDPGFALAHVGLSTVHGNMFWWRYDPSQARADLQRKEAEIAMQLAPHLPQAHVAMGMAHYRGRRDYRRALEELTIALQGLPNDAGITTQIGAVQRRLGNWDEAVAVFRKASQLDPRDVDTLADLGGTTFLYMRRFPEASDAFDRALRVAPDFHFAAVSKGLADVIRDGRLDTLRAVLDRLPRDAPLGQLGSSLSQRAQLLLWARQPEDLLRVVEAAPTPVFDAQRFFLPTSLYAGWAHQLRGDLPAARAAFDSARVLVDAQLTRLPDDWRLHAAHGMALAGLGRRDEAMREADWLRQSAVYREDALYGPMAAEDRARILAQAGETNGAIDEIERLLTRPSLVSAHTLRLDPRWDPIRDNPRLKALIAQHTRH
jgi:TolB-like protein/tRNA A-37 threonylcarbamoyl transferase component Bud32/Flp pilus assembly protein TadD